MKIQGKIKTKQSSEGKVKKLRLEVRYNQVQIYRHDTVREYRIHPFYKEIYVHVVKYRDKRLDPYRYAQCTLNRIEVQRAYEAGCRDKDVFFYEGLLGGLNTEMYKEMVPGKYFLDRLKNLIGIEDNLFNDVYVINDLEVKESHQHGKLTTDLFRQMAIDFPGIWICCIEPSQFYKGWEREIGDYLDAGYPNFTEDFELARPKLGGRAEALGFRPFYNGRYFIALSTDLLQF